MEKINRQKVNMCFYYSVFFMALVLTSCNVVSNQEQSNPGTNKPLTIQITSLTNGQIVYDENSIVISGTAGGSDLLGVYAYLNNELYLSATGLENWQATIYNYSKFKPGTNIITATAFSKDSSGITNCSVYIILQNSRPVVTINAPITNGQSIVTNGNKVTFKGRVVSPDNLAIVDAEIYVNNNFFQVTNFNISIQSGNWTKDIVLGEGQNDLYIMVKTTNGQQDEEYCTVKVDSKGPVVNINLPTPDYASYYLENNNITITGTTSSLLEGVKEVWYSSDGLNYLKLTGTTSWTKTENLTAGSHSIFVYGIDNSGNAGATNQAGLEVRTRSDMYSYAVGLTGSNYKWSGTGYYDKTTGFGYPGPPSLRTTSSIMITNITVTSGYGSVSFYWKLQDVSYGAYNQGAFYINGVLQLSTPTNTTLWNWVDLYGIPNGQYEFEWVTTLNTMWIDSLVIQ